MKLEFSDRIHRLYFWLLVAAVVGFVVVPVPEGGGLMGMHFHFGWPLPVLEGKVGFLNPQSPRGFHPFITMGSLVFSVLGLALWAAIFFGINRLAAKLFVPGWLLYPGIVILFSTSIVMNLFGGFWFFMEWVGS